MRVAYLSPLPPQTSGIADYSAELLPPLARHLEVELVVEDGVAVGRELAAAFPVQTLRRFPELLATGRYDAALYHLGNNRDFHAGIYRRLLAHPVDVPAVLVLHEYVLHHLVRDVTLHAGDPDAYVEAMRWCYGRSGEAVARRAVATGVPLDPFRFPLFERAVDAAAGVIVHNRTTAGRVLASRPEARVQVVPHHLSLAGLPAVAREEARHQLGIPAADFVVATFGFLTEAKRLPVLLRAFARLRGELPADRAAGTRLELVGEVSPHYDFARIFAPELRAGVEITGRLELDRFLLHMAACDVAVNLRHPTAGETSGTLVRLLGLGKPVIVTRAGAFAEIPDGCCAKVDLDEDEEDLLVATLRALAKDPALRQVMGENARRYVAAQTPEVSAAAYAGVVRDAVEKRWRPAPCPPPLAPFAARDLFAELVRDSAAELADLGIGERDEEVLAPVAQALVELDLDRAGRGTVE
ncbi:MAG TPA: glycosyltransferase family 4 protein [Thermoanaerobaculia bacterium]|jgi:glycosyltransferase involved in cell wall biosynthesis|nr:glycosyltransferase family 4 protein [Thermoanaerobaculia bacterium]